MFARTDRLLLRPGFAEDAPALALALGDAGVTRNLSHVPQPYGLADAQEWLAIEHPPLLPHMLMVRRTLGAPDIIGCIGFNAMADGQVEIGYWVRRDCWGLGYASEAGRAAMAMARAHHLPRLHAVYYADNPASGRVLSKIGFRPTGARTTRHSRARGGPVEAIVMAEDMADAMRCQMQCAA
ncbi:MAG: GNAT family N-acetyltransferase [Sphingomonadaceae bacterium]|nr:GNAT family N-acetyltransferase [Sphingomonadaceae bacterium]